LDPKWPYPQSKVATEKIIRAKRGDISVVILRVAGVYDDLCNSPPLAQQIQGIYEYDLTAYFFPGEVSAGRQAFVHNEDLLVPNEWQRRALWTSRVWPGALLVEGETVGTWRRAEQVLTIQPWRRLSRAQRAAVEVEAGSLPLPGIDRPMDIRWDHS
jgi:hypothetical protein